MENNVRVGGAVEVWAHGSAELGESCAQQADRSSNAMGLIGPGRSGTRTMGRRSRERRERRLEGEGTRQASLRIASNGVTAKHGGSRMLGNDAPEKQKLAAKEVGPRLKTVLGGHHESNIVGGGGIVGRQAGSDG